MSFSLVRRGAVLVYVERLASGRWWLVATEDGAGEPICDETEDTEARVRGLCEPRIARAEDPDARAGWPAEMAVVA